MRFMQLQMPAALGDPYHSPSQKVRVISEGWGQANLYCPACPSNTLRRLHNNAVSIDFQCGECASWFQLKSSKKGFGPCILDGAYKAMCETITAGKTPSLFLLHYDPLQWEVQNLTVIPSFAFSFSCVKQRNALSATAQRKFYVGCYIMLTNIPPDAHVPVVANGAEEKPKEVRRRFGLLRPISKLDAEQRGWTLDVLKVVRSLGKKEFSLGEIYAHASELSALHPANRHVEDKIRQQLQRLRDFGFLEFLGGGSYRVTR